MEFLLRKLTNDECVFEKFNKINEYITSRAFLIESKIDLFKNKSLVYAGIHHWKQLHPLLRATIQLVDNQYWYALASAERANSTDNVEFLYCESNDINEQDYWKYLFERECSINFDSSNELLWRLQFLILNKNDDIFKYAVQFTTHHAITDGRNAHVIFLQLMKFIEQSFKNELKPINEIDMQLASLEYNYPEDPRFPSIQRDDRCELDLKNPPECLKWPNNSDETAKPLSGTFYKLNNTIFSTIEETVNNRKVFKTRFKFYTFEPAVLVKLLVKCRKHGVKLTSCLDLIVALSLLKITKQRSYEHLFTDFGSGLCCTTISMKQFFKPPLDSHVMGVWLAFYSSSYDRKFDFELDNTEFWSVKFWQLAWEKYQEFYNFVEKLKNLEYYKMTVVESQPFYNKSIELIGNVKSNQLYSFYEISNLGEMKSCEDDTCSMIKICNRYTGSSYNENNIFCCSHFDFTTINKHFMCCMSYNNTILSDSAADQWFEEIKSIIEKIT